MKKLIILLLIIAILGCKKQEFAGERPDERLTKTLQSYNSQLSDAKYGWKAHLFPHGGRGFGFYFEFNGKNRVTMISDITSQGGSKPMESSYRLRATLLPSLYFDTYSYIHVLSDPDPTVYGGQPGWGLYSDFEFSFVKVTADTIKLKGNLSGSELVLIRASQDEQAAYKAGNLNVMRQQVKDFLQNTRFNYLETSGGTPLSTTLSLDNKTLSLTVDSSSKITTRQLGFAFSGLNELVLSAPFHYEDLYFDKILIDPGSKKLTIPNKGRNIEFLSTAQPIFPLSKMIGIDYRAIVVPMEQQISGSGTAFNQSREAFLAAARPLVPQATFPQMGLVFDTVDETMIVQQIITQNGTNFSAFYVFAYKKNGDEYQFKYEGPMYQNAQILENAFRPIIEGLTSGNIILNYELSTNTLRASGIRADDPAFKFIGDLQ